MLANGYDIKTITEPGLYMVLNPTNAPSSVGGWHAVEFNYASGNFYLKAYVFDTQKEFICRRRYSEDWSEWTPTATATPPQEFELPLASGWSNYSGMRSRYWKNQFDEVSVVVDISNPNTVSHGAVVATLPEGFRPAAAFDAPTIIYDGSEILPVRAYFSTNGQISISGYSNQTWSKVLFFETQASFIAVS